MEWKKRDPKRAEDTKANLQNFEKGEGNGGRLAKKISQAWASKGKSKGSEKRGSAQYLSGLGAAGGGPVGWWGLGGGRGGGGVGGEGAGGGGVLWG